MLQILADWSSDEVANILASGENTAAYTGPVCPSSVVSHSQVAASHILAVQSCDVVTTASGTCTCSVVWSQTFDSAKVFVRSSTSPFNIKCGFNGNATFSLSICPRSHTVLLKLKVTCVIKSP